MLRWIFVTFFFFMEIAEGYALGSKRPAACSGPEVKEIPVLVSASESPRAYASYSFAFYPPKSTNLPTVVYIPGGPGQGLIRHGRPFLLGAAYEYGALLIDPRGVGCNENPRQGKFADSVIASNLSAEDILAVIRSLKLENYLIYGASYGTVLATMVAAKIEQQKLPKPRALLLDGVIGRHFNSKDEIFREYSIQWGRYLKRLPLEVQLQLTGKEGLPLGLSALQWGEWILYGTLLNGTQLNSFREPFWKLSGLKHSATISEKDELKKEIEQSGASLMLEAINPRVHLLLSCKEIFGLSKQSAELRNGELRIEPVPDDCTELKMIEPFDSAQWPLSVPTYYFSGGLDPATPLWQAKYHIMTHRDSLRTWIQVPHGGHGSLLGKLKGCDEIWRSIGEDAMDLGVALQECGLVGKVEILKFIPGEIH